MYERFTDRSRKVMQLANQEAQRFNHEYIGTEHILLGLVKEGSGVAANVLKNLDIDFQKVRRQIEQIVQHGPGADRIIAGQLPPTPRSKKVIEYAIEEARVLKHNYVGTEHLLLGLLREEEGVAAQVLTNLGLKLEDVRQEVLNLLGPTVLDSEPPVVHLPAPPIVVEGGDAGQPIERSQIDTAQGLLRRLFEERDGFVAAQDFDNAARRRSEAEALMALIAWYVRTRGR